MRADARRNYERLVATARDVFFEHGVDAPLDDIAKRAQVGPGTLYRHFPTRGALVEAVYRGEIEAFAAKAHAFAKELPPAEALRAWMREQVLFVLDRGGSAAALKAVIDEDSETFRYCKQLLHEAVAAILAPAKAAGAVRADLEPTDVLRLGHGIGSSARHADAAGLERLLSIVLDGVAARP